MNGDTALVPPLNAGGLHKELVQQNGDEKKVFAQAATLLARREYSAVEIRRKLLSKGFFQEHIDKVLAKLSDLDYQSDERFALGFVRDRIRRGQGPQRMVQELVARGIEMPLIEKTLEEHSDEFLASVRGVWYKKFQSAPDSPLEKQKQSKFLIYRGFTFDQIEYLWGQLELC